MPSLIQVTPFLRVPDIDRALEFFCETLGFELEFRTGVYAFVRRDAVAFRVIEDEVLPARGQGRYTSYVDVDDIDALYQQWKPKLDLLPPGTVCPPCDQEYGQRDLTIVGPDGDIIAFGSPIDRRHQ
jgi:catechol 2,3-dioxygenase-like lactoylglutathione lyase family enzyme